MLCVNASYEFILLYVANAVTASQVVLTAVFGYVILREKLNMKQCIGIILATVCLMGVYFLVNNG